MSAIWNDDLLGFQKYGITFGRVVRHIQTGRVISIEAGFGRGKSFFRERWAKQLREEGERVVEIDALRSDHTGDPLVTLISAMLSQLPEEQVADDWSALLLGVGKRFLLASTKVAVNTIARGAADEVAAALQDDDADGDDLGRLTKAAIEDAEEALSKEANAFISTQIAAERTRAEELPKQISRLQKFLTKDLNTDRVIVIIDELDRCHPDYTLKLIESLKKIFDKNGFVFVIMANPEYMQGLAESRFGDQREGEQYLEKFVDLRLQLPLTTGTENAISILCSSLPDYVPWRKVDEFMLPAATMVAIELAREFDFSMRQIERSLNWIEVTMLCTHGQRIDLPLLTALAFEAIHLRSAKSTLEETDIREVVARYIPRINLDKERFKKIQQAYISAFDRSSSDQLIDVSRNCSENFQMLIDARIPFDSYRRFPDWIPQLENVADRHVSSAKAQLDAVLEFENN